MKSINNQVSLLVVFKLFPLFLLSGCVVLPVPDGTNVAAGTPISGDQIQTILKKGTARESIIEAFGEPTWTGFDQKVMTYEGVLDRKLFVAIAGGGALGAGITSTEHGKRVILYFDDNGNLVDFRNVFRARIVQLAPPLIRMLQTLEFMTEQGFPKELLTEQTINQEFLVSPFWRSEKYSAVFYGTYTDYSIDGVILILDDNNHYVHHRRPILTTWSNIDGDLQRVNERLEKEAHKLVSRYDPNSVTFMPQQPE